jgi:hypothetical protein
MALAGCRMYRHLHAHDPASPRFGALLPALVPEDDHHVQHLKCSADDDEHIDGGSRLHMLFQESAPAPKDVERVIGSIRRDCLDYTIIFNERRSDLRKASSRGLHHQCIRI